MYEMLWTDNHITEEKWITIINAVADYIGEFKKFFLIVQIENNTMHYYLKTKEYLPPKIKEELPFLLKESKQKFENKITIFPFFSSYKNNILNIYTKTNKTLEYITIAFRKINDKLLYKIIGNFKRKYKRLYFRSFSSLISIDFSNFSSIFFKKAPTYLKMNKTLPLLSYTSINSILRVNTYPYFNNEYYLNQNNYDYNKHSLILGSSGAGKSKFISSFIKNTLASNNTKIVVIDPHGALEKDIGGLGKVIDFNINGIDVFGYNNKNIIASQEKIVVALKSIFNDTYNSKIERLLKYSIYLLLMHNEFNLMNLKKVLLDSEYRNVLLSKSGDNDFLISFFTSDFNDLKTKSYSEAFIPIISLIDEIAFIPAFNMKYKNTIEEELEENDLLLFSMNPSKLGLNNLKLLSALVMNKIMAIKENGSVTENIIFIIDEVSVVENEILSRILSEGRKYGLSLILAGQFLDQLSLNLKNSIFANTLNYYLFRISKSDATTISNNIDIDIVSKDTGDKLKETKYKLLTNLNDRELIIRLNKNGINYPCIKASTLDFVSVPRIIETTTIYEENTNKKDKKEFSFDIGKVRQDELMKNMSTKRKVNIWKK